jgi:hypothetical protein
VLVVVSFTDDELRVIMDAARPIRPSDRDIFIRQVTAAIGAFPPERVGPGLVHRVAMDVQRRFRDRLMNTA